MQQIILFLDEELEFVAGALRTLCAWICTLIYPLLARIFQLFIDVAEIRLNFPFEDIFNRVTIMLTIIMIFYITFELIKYLLEPDNLTSKEKGVGKIGYKVLIVIVLIAFTPTIFTKAWEIQNMLIQKDVIAKIVFGKSGDSVPKDKRGNEFAATVLGLFYKYEYGSNGIWINDQDGTKKCINGIACQDIVDWNLNELKENGSLPSLYYGLNAASENPNPNVAKDSLIAMITFDGLFAVGVGAFILYVLVLYTIDLATRIFQLTYLEIIAPIPIICYLAPQKSKVFSKWAEQCLMTYLDVFIRLSVIDFVLLICEKLSEGLRGGFIVGSYSSASGLIYIVLIMGLLLFAKKVPKLLEELFPKMGAAGGNFGLKAGDRVAPLAAKALGLTWGATKLGGALVRRAAQAHANNRANGRHSIFTKEGREERKQERENRRKARFASRLSASAAADAENLEKSKGEATAAGEALGKKRKELYNSKYKDKFADIKKRRDDINNSTTMSEGEKRAALASLNLEEANLKSKHFADQKKLTESTPEGRRLTQATERMANWNSNTSQMINESESRIKTAEANKARLLMQRGAVASEREKAQYDKLIKNQDAIIGKEREKISTIKSTATALRDSGKRTQTLDELKQKSVAAQEQVYEDKNKHYQGALGVAASAVAGTAKIMHEGAKSTKLEDVGKNVSQGVKKDIADTRNVQKYYEAGGTGWVDRTIQQVEKNMGIPTAYERTILESRSDEPKIKRLDAQVALSKDVSTTADSADDRLQDKIGDLSLEAQPNTIKTGLKKADGTDEYADVVSGETLADVYRKYEGRATSAQAEADQAAKRLDDFNAENYDILTKNKATLVGDELAKYETAAAQREQLEKQKEEKATNASRAKYAVSQVKKNAAREEYTAILKDFASGKTLEDLEKDLREGKIKYDGPAVEKAYNALRSLEVYKSNPYIVEDMRKTLSQDDFEAFISGKIDSFKMLDRIKIAAINAGNVYERESKAMKENQRRTQTSNETAAQKAANDFTSSGGGNK